MIRYLLLLVLSVQLVWGETPSVTYGARSIQDLHASFAKHIPIKLQGKNLIGYLKFNQEYPINESSFIYVKYALEYFKHKKVDFIIVHLNTFGGEILPTVKIIDLFQKCDINEGIPLMAFIDRYAIGSSALLAYACRFIAVSQDALMGGQVPGRGVTDFSFEMMDDLLNEYASAASIYGRDPVLAEAMVDSSIILVERQGQVLQLYDPGDIITKGPNLDVVISNQYDWLTLDAAQLLKAKIADFQIQVVNKEDFNSGSFFSFDQCLLSKEPYLASIPEAYVLCYQNWKFKALRAVSHPSFFALLLLVAVFSLYIQMYFAKPNMSGVLGCAALVCMVLVSVVLREFSWAEGLLLVFGFALYLIRRVLKIRSYAIGWLGLLVMAVGLFSLAIPGFDNFKWLDFEAHAAIMRSVLGHLVWIIITVILLIVCVIYTKIKYPNRFKLNIYLPEPLKDLEKEPENLEKLEGLDLPREGLEGITHCTLRPFGKVVIHGKIYDAVSLDHVVILKKTRIIILGHENGKLLVKEYKSIL